MSSLYNINSCHVVNFIGIDIIKHVLYIIHVLYMIWYAYKRYIYIIICVQKNDDQIEFKASSVPSNPPTVEATSFLVANLVSESCPWMAILDVAHWWSPFRNPSAFFTYCKSIPSPPIPRCVSVVDAVHPLRFFGGPKKTWDSHVSNFLGLPQVSGSETELEVKLGGGGGVCSVNIDWPGETGTLEVYKGGPLTIVINVAK